MRTLFIITDLVLFFVLTFWVYTRWMFSFGAEASEQKVSYLSSDNLLLFLIDARLLLCFISDRSGVSFES
jgi:hypothetical protein